MAATTCQEEQAVVNDFMTTDQRSRMMSGVRNAGTEAERAVRSVLHRMGYRFRLQAKNLPGKPDIVLPKYQIAIFMHGCFWHQHQGCNKAKRPVTHVEFWNKKLDDNIVRDQRSYQLLIEQGWRVLVVWECETRNREQLAVKLKQAIEILSQSSDQVGFVAA